MMELLFVVFFVILGAVMGSFCCCQVWRIRYKEEGKEKLGERSVCLHCKKQLRWYENIPVVSWLVQGGRCRKCGKKIGNMEIISEIVGAVMFGVLGSVTVFGGFGFPFGAGEGLGVSMIEAVVIGVGFVLMLMLAIYDAKWGELPMFLLIALAIIGVVLRIIVLYMTWELD